MSRRVRKEFNAAQIRAGMVGTRGPKRTSGRWAPAGSLEHEAYLEHRRATRKPLTEAQKQAQSERLRKWKRLHPEAAVTLSRRTASDFAKRDRKRNPEKWAVIDMNHVHRRRALKGDGHVSTEQWSAIKESFGHRCAYCLRDGLRLTQDHVVALSKGGAHDVTNIVPACKPCNTRKRERGVLSMLKYLEAA